MQGKVHETQQIFWKYDTIRKQIGDEVRVCVLPAVASN
jgi:hypothetical protein